jgi:hypothetical protein
LQADSKVFSRLLLIFDNYENNAYELQNELLFSFKDQLNVKVLIGSVEDRKRLEQVFSEYRRQLYFMRQHTSMFPLWRKILRSHKKTMFSGL